jgi:ectoine hydroxylase-related dioxygenase (phytanoyl-CoA dioxygenase family)
MPSLHELEGDYARDGCVRIKHFLSPDLLAEVRKNLDHFLREIVPTLPAGNRTFEADGKTVRNLFHLEKFDPFFQQLADRAEIRSLIGKLVHGEPVLMAVETFNKPPRVGSGVPPHQDNAYFAQSPPDVLTVWIAMDAATMENGPIYYLKGSHKAGMLPHRPSGVAGNSMGLSKMPQHADADEFCGTLDPGDALIHHCQTIHWSAPNKTDAPRCGLLLVYRGAHTRPDPSLKDAYAQANAPKAAQPVKAG